MGNCIRRKAIPAGNQKNEPTKAAKTVYNNNAAGQSSAFRAAKTVENRKEKKVRFSLRDEDHASNNGGESCKETKSGVVRIRLVLTLNELNQILNGELKHSSAEQLLNVIKSRSKRDTRGRSSSDLDRNGDWMPVLESIPEDNHD